MSHDPHNHLDKKLDALAKELMEANPNYAYVIKKFYLNLNWDDFYS